MIVLCMIKTINIDKVDIVTIYCTIQMTTESEAKLNTNLSVIIIINYLLIGHLFSSTLYMLSKCIFVQSSSILLFYMHKKCLCAQL